MASEGDWTVADVAARLPGLIAEVDRATAGDNATYAALRETLKGMLGPKS